MGKNWMMWVYPRVGGGNSLLSSTMASGNGLSPRGRGKRAESHRLGQVRRSIPAWAGETALRPFHRISMAVYPRVGGGNLRRAAVGQAGRGLSPRGRGKRNLRPRPGQCARSIPAWAGETLLAALSRLTAPVYPRVGGGNGDDGKTHWNPEGLSPRGRGKLRRGWAGTV